MVRVDDPVSAYHHVRQLIAAAPDCASTGPCENCAAESIGNGTWQDAIALLRTAGVDVQPHRVEDVRVPSPLPQMELGRLTQDPPTNGRRRITVIGTDG